MSYLFDRITSRGDLRKLNYKELNKLSQEIREEIVERVKVNGGHLASNLGAVEITVALHRVFDTPTDQIVWDVGHQTYTHKLLTERREAFSSIRKRGGLSGFPSREESPHDSFGTGHASTSISAGLGLDIGKRLTETDGKVVAVIGDGSLTGGLAFEALNNGSHPLSRLIIIVNDNNMSISRNVGAFSTYLSRLISSGPYIFTEDFIRKVLFFKTWRAGALVGAFLRRVKRGVKGLLYKNNLFTDFGFKYIGPLNGHNIKELEQVFRKVKKIDAPVVIHLVTQKGRGVPEAAKNPDLYHGVEGEGQSPPNLLESSQTFTQAISEFLPELAKKEKRLVAITAAMDKGTGLSSFRQQFPKRFFDVGIAEGHAVTFSAGLAASGLIPVTALYSTFLQRSLDNLIHDIAIQKLPAIFLVDRSGLVPHDGITHQGIYDIALFKALPATTIIAPIDRSDLSKAIEWSLSAEGPVIIRYPKAYMLAPSLLEREGKEIWNPGKGRFLEKSKRSSILIIGVGPIVREALIAAEYLKKEGLFCDIYSLTFVNPIDFDELTALISGYQELLILEEGVAKGGIGETIIAELLLRESSIEVAYFALREPIQTKGSRDELIIDNRLSHTDITSYLTEKHSEKKYMRKKSSINS